MSCDRKIDQVCPHLVLNESLFVGSDRQTIVPLRPVAAVSSIRVFLNNEIEVPSEGVGLSAQSRGTEEGLIDITTGVNDIFRLSINQKEDQVVVLPPLFGVSMPQVVVLLNLGFNDEIVFSIVNNKVFFQTTRTGLSESVFIPDTSTLAAALGFQTNREYRGRTNIPGWTVVGDPNTLEDRPTKLIVFDEPLDSGSSFVEISYVTVREECRRCGGSGVENDWRYDLAGEAICVRDEPLLIQELTKDFFSVSGSNPFHSWYGTELIEMVGKKLSSGGFAQNFVVSDLYTAFSRWKSVKTQQEERAGQFVSDEEHPQRLLSVDLEQSTVDPTVLFVNVTVMNRSNKQIQLSRGLRLPLPIDLLGTTTQAAQARTARIA